MKKSMFLLISSSILGIAMLSSVETTYAHGYVETPPARGYQGMLDKDTIGWEPAMKQYGNVITNPQSLEAPKGFPESGPSDGRIASANGGSGQIGDFVLDNQSSDSWKKSDVRPGPNTFTWHYTAAHKTSKWHYYMTKPGWNPDESLKRSNLELIGTVNHDGSTSTNNLSHTINIPEDRLGYNIILAVWDVADTSNAFYNVIDVNVKNTGLPVIPSKPKNVKINNVTKASVSLVWDTQASASMYDIYRDGKKIGTSKNGKFDDNQLISNTEYMYEIVAINSLGQLSEKSDGITIKTLADNELESATTPTGLHSMRETSTEVSLMWNPSSHSSGISKYEIYRNGKLLAESKETMYTDSDLSPNTDYNYKIKSVSNDGSNSKFSKVFSVRTKSDTENPNEGKYRPFKLGTFDSPESYTVGELVEFNNKVYTTLQSHFNYGDTTWNPNDAKSLFNLK